MKFKINLILRTFSLMLLSCIPAFYLYEILPFFILPVWSLIIILICLKIEIKKIKFSSSVILIISACITFLLIILFICRIISLEVFDVLYLRLSMLIPIIIVHTIFISLQTMFFLKKHDLRKYEPIIFFTVFSLLFFPQSSYDLSIFEHSIYAAAFALIFFLTELVRIFLYWEKRQIMFFIIFLPMLAVILIFLLKKYNDLSITNHGGLLQPTFFKFDFTDYLSLQDEIKMSNDLILIAHFDNTFSHNMLRRFYLSGWDPAKGFFEKAAPDENPQLISLPKNEKVLEHKNFDLRESVQQEYFFVNLPSSSFISIDYPTKIIPYKIWDSVKFNGAYKVFSNAVYGFADTVYGFDFPTGNKEEGLSEADLKFYTSIDKLSFALVHDKAEELTRDLPAYYDKIFAIQEYFLNGDFRYSLKPGKAPGGDQLKYFLTENKKGYCTYYAFSFALMLRSLGIPSRVAVGFFVQPESEILNYYPIRSNMAHAWVEVFFPYAGWISFDPTTQILAEGESLNFGKAGGDEFNSLLTEILERRIELQNSETIEEENINSANELNVFFKKYKNKIWLCILFLVFIIIVLYTIRPYIIFSYSKNNRKIILTINKILNVKKMNDEEKELMFKLVQKAKFAPYCTKEDSELARKILLNQKKWSIHKKGYLFMIKKISLIFIFSFSVLVFSETAEEFASLADSAIAAENWEKALESLQKGIQQYPLNEELLLKLGLIYQEKELYKLAYKIFKKGLSINANNILLLYNASSSAAFLNKPEEALQYMKKYLVFMPEDRFAWATLGWLYFKCHKEQEGVDVLLDNIKNYGEDASIYNSLGTLYSELFDYANAYKYYSKAINLSKIQGRNNSSSVYSYNKSILERQFYKFEQSLEAAKEALKFQERNSSYMMIGELEERRNNFPEALSAYTAASALDDTPLSALSIATIFLATGHIERAEQYIFLQLKNKDEAWISTYGLSVTEFKSTLYDLQKKLYKLKYNYEKKRLTNNFFDYIKNISNRIKYKLLYLYYDSVQRNYKLKSIREYKTNDPAAANTPSYHLRINGLYYSAFKDKGKKALKYLERSEKIETELIPKSVGTYTAEKGLCLKDLHLINEGINTLDPEWEKFYFAELYAASIKIAKKHSSNYRSYVRTLYTINPAAFLEFDIQFPVKLQIEIQKNISHLSEKKIKKLIRNSRFIEDSSSDFELHIKYSDEILSFKLLDKNNSVIYSDNKEIKQLNKKKFTSAVNENIKKIFSIKL